VELTPYLARLDKEKFAAGETIFAEGDIGNVMYIVVDGEVDVVYDRDRSVRLGVGESFGEMALIDKRPRSATVKAATDVALARINQAEFLILVQDTPYFALEVMRCLSDRLRRANGMPGTVG